MFSKGTALTYNRKSSGLVKEFFKSVSYAYLKILNDHITFSLSLSPSCFTKGSHQAFENI